jgi:hypothetical protein
MAGFVMADPRFTKNPDVAGQRTDLVKAIRDGGDQIQLYITEERRRDLEGPLNRMVRTGGNINEMVYAATDGGMTFVLRRSFDGPGANGKQLWAVFYGSGEIRLSNDLSSPNKGTSGNLLPVMAMVDPACPASIRRTYRAATTGDYDLFAIFPQRLEYDRSGADKRMVPDSDRFRQGIKKYIEFEDHHRGNLTPRIASIRHQINAGVSATGYAGGDVVHHSDEAGRPFVSNVDYPFIAFVPDSPEAYCVQTTSDFKDLLRILHMEYVITFNPGWHSQLGFMVSNDGNYTV